MAGGNAWKGVIAAACERTVSLPQNRFAECGGGKRWPWCRWRLRPVCASVFLPSGPSHLLVTVLSTRNMEAAPSVLSSHPFASTQELLGPFILSGPLTNEEHAPPTRTCYLTPSSVLPGLWRSRIPGRGTQKEILVLRNAEENCFRPLFLK